MANYLNLLKNSGLNLSADILLTSAYVLFSSSSWALPSISYLLHPFVHRLALKAFIRLDQLGPLFLKTGQEIVGAITKHIKSILRSVTV